MSFDQYVPTSAIQKAVRGRETEVLKALDIAWDEGAKHLTCPYPDHADEHPSWQRLMPGGKRAHAVAHALPRC